MTAEPRKSFGFLNRAAEFGVKPPFGPMFGILPVKPALQSCDVESTLQGRTQAQTGFSPVSESLGTSGDREHLTRMEARKQRQRRNEAWMRKRYAQFDPWKGENA